MEYLGSLSLYRTETLYSCSTCHKVLCHIHCDISMATQWAPDPLHSKGKIIVSLHQEVLFALVVHSVFIPWVSVNVDITRHKQKKVC